MAAQPSVPNNVTVASPGPQRSAVGTTVGLQVKASDSASGQTLTYTAAGLPPALSINPSTGLISGTTSSTPGTFTVTVTAQDTTGASGSTVFGWVTIPEVTVASPGSQASATGTAVSLQIQASVSPGGAPLSYSAAGLPPGISINSSTGLISGTPSTPGTFRVTVTAQDIQVFGASGSAVFTWIIRNLVTVARPQTQSSSVGLTVGLQVKASDSASGQTLTYTAAGLPPALSINPSTGLISGTTSSTPGTFTVTVTAQDTTGASGSAVFGWNILADPNGDMVNNPGDQDSLLGFEVTLQIEAQVPDIVEALTYTATGLPPGLSILPSGLIGGTPTTAGVFVVTVTAQDTAGTSGSVTFAWTIHAIVPVANPGSQSSSVGAAISLPIAQILTYTATGLPPGLSINPSTGLISGTVTTAGVFMVTVTAQDTTGLFAGASGSAAFIWNVQPG